MDQIKKSRGPTVRRKKLHTLMNPNTHTHTYKHHIHATQFYTLQTYTHTCLYGSMYTGTYVDR